MAPPRLRILVFPETHGTWTARGLEHDLAAEGRKELVAGERLVGLDQFVCRHVHAHFPVAAGVGVITAART